MGLTDWLAKKDRMELCAACLHQKRIDAFEELQLEIECGYYVSPRKSRGNNDKG